MKLTRTASSKDGFVGSLKGLPPLKLPPGYKYLDDYPRNHYED